MSIIGLFFSVFLYCNLSMSWCFNFKADVKLHGNSLTKLSKYAAKVEQDLKEVKNNMKMKTIQYKLYNTSIKANNTLDDEDIDIIERNSVFAHVSKEGIFKLESLGHLYKNILNSNFTISEDLQNVTDAYIAALGTYFDIMGKHEVKMGIDRKFYFLDIVETSNQIFHNESKRLLDNINALMNNAASEIDILMLTKQKDQAVIDEKKDNLQYICENLHICRNFPSFFDNVAELMTEILKLSDSNFHVIVNFLKEVDVIRTPFYETIIDGKIVYKINSMLKHLCIRGEREALSTLREIITHRYKTYKSDEDITKPRTMAVKILTELIDKMFEMEGEAINKIKFDNVKEVLKARPKSERQELDMRKVLTDFCKYSANIIKFNLDLVTMEEVEVLAELVAMGNSENNIVVDDLLAKGSTYVNIHNEDPDFSVLNVSNNIFHENYQIP